MAVLTFTKPSPTLNGTLAMANAKEQVPTDGVDGTTTSDQVRSMEGASNAAMSTPSDARNPLAHHQPAKTTPGVTFAAQDSLPKLPIPDLDATCQRYLEALEPLQTNREHHETERAVREFQRREGPELQEKLKEYSQGKSSYIEQFCKPCPTQDCDTYTHSG